MVRQKIYGEDGSTVEVLNINIGDANLVEWGSFLSLASPQYFPMPPYYTNQSETESTATPDARVGWRDTIRVGKNIELPIEDLGIKSEMIVRPTRLDLQPF
jgi:hypothetical protein